MTGSHLSKVWAKGKGAKGKDNVWNVHGWNVRIKDWTPGSNNDGCRIRIARTPLFVLFVGERAMW